MARRILTALAVLVFILASVFLFLSAIESWSTDRTRRGWARTFGTPEEIVERYPHRAANAAALRIEAARTLQQQRDEGAIHAVAQGLQLLETGLPPTNPYICATVISTSTGNQSFTVTFSSSVANEWTVQAFPTIAGPPPPPMPPGF